MVLGYKLWERNLHVVYVYSQPGTAGSLIAIPPCWTQTIVILWHILHLIFSNYISTFSLFFFFFFFNVCVSKAIGRNSLEELWVFPFFQILKQLLMKRNYNFKIQVNIQVYFHFNIQKESYCLKFSTVTPKHYFIQVSHTWFMVLVFSVFSHLLFVC